MQISVTKLDGMAIKSCGSDSHGATVCDPSPGHSPMGLGRGLDLHWLENWAGRTVLPISLHYEQLGGLLWRLRNQSLRRLGELQIRIRMTGFTA